MPDAGTATPDIEQITEQVLLELSQDQPERLDAILAPLHAGDVAEIISRLPFSELRVVVFRHTPDELSGDVLDLLPEHVREEVVDDLTPRELVEAVAEMSPDDATDLVTDLEPEAREALLEQIPAEQSEAIRELMQYPPESAGGLMTPQFASMPQSITAAEAIERLRRLADTDHEVIYYAYVVDERERLQGVLSLRDLLLSRSNQPIRDVMIPNVISVNVQTDQEEVARLFERYNFLALPVVDDENHLLGVVTVDDIIEVIHEEQSEDMQKMVGAGGDEDLHSPFMLSLRRRLPWLEVNLATAFLAAAVVSAFSSTIERMTALAVFMPICAGMAGNTGQQALSVVIRGVVLDTSASRRWVYILLREGRLGLLNGVFVALVASPIIYAFSHNAALALVLGVALVASMTTASIAGAGIPLLMRRLGMDPAQGSTVILTTVTDVAGFSLFLGLATALERYLHAQ